LHITPGSFNELVKFMCFVNHTKAFFISVYWWI
jgi:hypothetical protein